ncbi:GNAT family N-acetyltransferase [Paraglaciecola polaris]|uniref:N-acetyltransferase domain-containing protein n=1 Tax=Paraglaciecola polaris LMG 21857 TaxID=1129793 RepID=K6ZLP4_9ALTE|nr:hypothetical protein GPLA_0338 [Paraglaciecola polaris LMG 21857]|tara:strand:- start:551 stop:760 length:210 start_codon:yes stop_codon:yes gene_type:complete
MQKNDRAFIGFVGLHIANTNLPGSPCVEIGWRLHRYRWAKGFATEAAEKALEYAFVQLQLTQLMSLPLS